MRVSVGPRGARELELLAVGRRVAARGVEQLVGRRPRERRRRQEAEVLEGEVAPREYDYLLSMPLWSLSTEKIEELTIAMN